MEWNLPWIINVQMELNTRLLQYRQLSGPQRQIAQTALIERLTEVVAAVQQNADPPGGALLGQLNQAVAAIQQNEEDPGAQAALVDLTEKVIETLGDLEGRAPSGP